MGTKVYNATLEIYSCASCHNSFGVPSSFADRGKDYGLNVWCPVCGHLMKFGPNEVAQLRSQLAQQEGATAAARAEAKLAEDRRRAEKAAKTRIKNRIAKGVCPCCNRYFAKVHEHIAKEHPDFAADASSGTDAG